MQILFTKLNFVTILFKLIMVPLPSVKYIRAHESLKIKKIYVDVAAIKLLNYYKNKWDTKINVSHAIKFQFPPIKKMSTSNSFTHTTAQVLLNVRFCCFQIFTNNILPNA